MAWHEPTVSGSVSVCLQWVKLAELQITTLLWNPG